MEFTVTLEEIENRIFLFRLKGEMDASTAPMLQARLAETSLGTVRFVLINLSGLKYMDTSGVGHLAAEVRRLQDMRKEVALLAPKGQVQKVLVLTNFGRVVPICMGLEEAYEKLGIDQ